MPQYFCCRVIPSGIGDQISQLARLYNVGRSFGLEYLFQELPFNRWSPDFDAWDFLGLGLGERRVKDFPDHEIVSVDGAAASYALRDGRSLASVLPPGTPDRAIVELVHSDQMYGGGILVPPCHGIDLREKLIKRHGEHVLATGRSNRLSICVHVRQGDCTWVKSGDHHVFLGMRKITSNSQDVDVRRAPKVDAYFPLLDAIVARLHESPYDLTVYSDGPTNVFPLRPSRCGRILYALARRDERLIDTLRLNRPGNPLQAFYNPMCDAEVRRGYDRAKDDLQRLAARYEHSSLVIGTGKELTAAAILAFASADVAVLARNPQVFPLLGLGDPHNQAVLLIATSIEENIKRLDHMLARRSPARP
ncbi:MAG: hypothetical protein ABJA98_24665 [Acidobacteriota bacterium]